jgi:type I restriction enzyme M protein
MWKNMGKKNSEITVEHRKEIIRMFTEMEESDVSKVFDNEEFDHWRITILQPEIDSQGCPKRDKKGRMVADKK